MAYSCKNIMLQRTKNSLNSFINVSLLHSCIVSYNGSGPWWFLVAQVQVIRLESSMTQEAGIETILPCFLSNSLFGWCLGFLCYCPTLKKKGSPLVLIPFTLVLVLPVMFCLLTLPSTYLVFCLATFSAMWIPAVGSWTCFFTSHILCKICLYCVYLCHPGYYKILLYHWSLTVLV